MLVTLNFETKHAAVSEPGMATALEISILGLCYLYLSRGPRQARQIVASNRLAYKSCLIPGSTICASFRIRSKRASKNMEAQMNWTEFMGDTVKRVSVYEK